NIDGMKINRDLSSSATASPVQTTAPQPSETSALQTTQPSSNAEQPSEEPSQTPDQTQPQPQQPEGNTPETWNIQQIIDCYKAGMQKTDDTYDCSTDQKMQLVGKLPGKAAAISGPVNLAMKLGSQPFNALTGGYWDLVPDDLISADAHTDGKYTVINLYPKEQTDGPGADEHEGTTGHVVNVVQGIDDFLAYVEENFGILNASYTQEGVVIHYRDAYAKDVKINNETGEMESGTWGYIIDLSIDDASLLGISLDGFKTTIQYDCWYPVED
ncbi:MAG: hypothetical protein MJ177_05860, partial [Clostridia bacterium]|nr:hypothetical protein [Clostridia bacterium]